MRRPLAGGVAMFQESFRISEPIRNGHHLTINASDGSMIVVLGSGTALSAAHEPKTAIMTTSPGQATQADHGLLLRPRRTGRSVFPSRPGTPRVGGWPHSDRPTPMIKLS